MTPPGHPRVQAFAESDEAGFSLIELLVVLAIVAAVAATASLKIGAGEDQRRMSRATDAVTDTLKRARMKAVESGAAVRVAIDPRQGTLQTDGEPVVKLGPHVGIGFDNIRKAPRAAEGDAAITFLPDGRASGGRVLIDAGGTRRTVEVNWLTGLVIGDGDAHAR